MDARSNSPTNFCSSVDLEPHHATQKWCFIGCLILPVVLLFACPVHGQEATTHWWNPTTWGGSDDSVRKSSYFSKSASEKPLFSMPTMPWSSTDKPAAAPTAKAGPTMFNKVGKSTKRAWNNTVDFLNPFNDAPAKPQQQGYQPQNTTTKQGSGMFGWMWREETTETPTSVNEFLKQERPQF